MFGNHEALEEIERLAGALGASGESAPGAGGAGGPEMAGRLTAMRRRWAELCTRAKGDSEKLSDSAMHWNVCQNRLQRLWPWLDAAEAYLQRNAGGATAQHDTELQLEEHTVRVIHSSIRPFVRSSVRPFASDIIFCFRFVRFFFS